MTIEKLKKVHEAKPFTPFALRLADGSRLRVPSPEMLWTLPGGRTVFVATGGEDYEIVDLLLVDAFEVGDSRARGRAFRH